MSELSLPTLLVAFATFRQKVQPEWFAHIHSHGHAAARLARAFSAACLKAASKAKLDEIEFGAYRHDIGKYLIPKDILLKPGPLDDGEREIISFHPVHGVEILRDLPYITTGIRKTVLHHHERWDGQGYPDGLAGTTIPFAARTVSIVDTYTALRSRGLYRSALSRGAACEEIRKMAGHELDPDLVHDFLTLVEGHVTLKIAKPADPDEAAYSSLIRETLRAVL
jgi:HD-GYP domain-containing protein (c-di-GMP phosphodiesterase class II)